MNPLQEFVEAIKSIRDFFPGDTPDHLIDRALRAFVSGEQFDFKKAYRAWRYWRGM